MVIKPRSRFRHFNLFLTNILLNFKASHARPQLERMLDRHAATASSCTTICFVLPPRRRLLHQKQATIRHYYIFYLSPTTIRLYRLGRTNFNNLISDRDWSFCSLFFSYWMRACSVAIDYFIICLLMVYKNFLYIANSEDDLRKCIINK